MGTVLIHAGMPKTGSTSVQTWLRRNAERLRADHATHILTDKPPGTGEDTDVVAFTPGARVVPMRFLLRYFAAVQGGDPGSAAALTGQFVASVSEAADRLGRVVLTAEGFSTPLAIPDDIFLTGLERLSVDHEVAFAYYVRPQDAALESRWRQWGYKSDLGPADWIRSQLGQLDYAGRLADATALAPSVKFLPLPFRRDLLIDGDVTTDFATRVLGVDPGEQTDVLDENPGIPLDLAILLREAPATLVQSRDGDGAARIDAGIRQLNLGKVTATWDLPESGQARESRAALRAFAHTEFEPGNRELIARYSWDTSEFIPGGGATADLEILDTLWHPQADPVTLAYFYAALGDLCVAFESRGRGARHSSSAG